MQTTTPRNRTAPIVMPPKLNEVSRVLLAARLATLEAEISALRRVLDPESEPYAKLERIKPYLSPKYPSKEGGK